MKKYRLGEHKKTLRFTENSKNRVVYNNYERLRTLKCKIDTCNQKEWEELKKLLNPYELIYTSSKHGNNICKINPVSRSYFKLHEMIKDQMPPARNGLYGAYKEILPAVFKQAKNPKYKIPLTVPS